MRMENPITSCMENWRTEAGELMREHALNQYGLTGFGK